MSKSVAIGAALVNATRGSQILPGLEIDFSYNNAYKEITTNESFTFKSNGDGKEISVIIKNTGVSTITVNFPINVIVNDDFEKDIEPNTYSVFTFMCAGDKVFGACIVGLA